jgi:DNA-binding MarR family transcriptional regulator
MARPDGVLLITRRCEMIAVAMTSPTSLESPSVATIPGDEPALALWQALASAHSALAARLDPEADACAVVGTDTVAVLLPLSLAPDQRLRMHELADRSHLTRSGLTRRVDRLVDDGWVERVYCDADRRGAYARLTDRGADELARALPHHVRTLELHLADRLTSDELTTLTELLSRL